ncbi:MAG: MgtC/SapB family protein [Amphiplicatus sp.]
MADLADFQNLAIAGAVGFLVGFQREWRDREEAKERTFAGARTFALAGFAGGAAGLLDEGGALIAIGLAGLAALTVAAYWEQARREPGLGGTTEVALIAVYILGALATRGEPALAGAGGVAVAILLALKPSVQRWARAIEARELAAALRFLAISVIILPLAPDQGYGPYEALNPRQIWRMVVLISGLSFLGYWLTKLYGARGVLLTGAAGGLASSTAATLSLSTMVRDGTTGPRAGAAGVVAANVMMLARIGALLLVVSTEVLRALWPALAAGGLAGALAAALFWRGEGARGGEMKLGNPMELRPAFLFAGLLAVIAAASRFVSERYGDAGLYALAAAAGLADVDAITLSAGGDAGRGALAPQVAAFAILIAAAANALVKAGMSAWIAGRAAGWRVAAAFAAMAAAAAGALFAAGDFAP